MARSPGNRTARGAVAKRCRADNNGVLREKASEKGFIAGANAFGRNPHSGPLTLGEGDGSGAGLLAAREGARSSSFRVERTDS